MRWPRWKTLCQTVRQFADRHRVVLVGEAIFGVAAAAHQRHDAVPDFPARHAGTERDDLAGDFEAGNIRCAGRRRIAALALHDIRAIDAGGCHLDQDLTVAGRRHCALFGHERLGSAGGLDANDGHAGRKVGHEVLDCSENQGLFRRTPRM